MKVHVIETEELFTMNLHFKDLMKHTNFAGTNLSYYFYVDRGESCIIFF